MTQEYIICAAIHFDDGKVHANQYEGYNTGFVICGRRHHNVFATISALDKRHTKLGRPIQGFITSYNAFVDRVKARGIAIAAGQCDEKNLKYQLYSEDLY